MALLNLKEILKFAETNKSAIGCFNQVNMETVRGTIAAAQDAKIPVILGVPERLIKRIDFEGLGRYMVQIAKDASVPCTVHLDHCQSIDVIKKALSIGFTSVMYDGSHLSLEENIERTIQVVELAKTYNASVEGELGSIADGSESLEIRGVSKTCYTDVESAIRYCEATGVTALAPSIGTVHGKYTAEPKLDYDRLFSIHKGTGAYLVLHGGSGLSSEQFERCIELGIRKINIFTEIGAAVVDRVKADIMRDSFNIIDMSEAVVQATYSLVKEKAMMFAR